MTPAIGDVLGLLRINAVSTDAMRSWATFLRDPNPLHLDANVVKAKGLGDRVINQGPANLAYVISMLQAAFPTGQINSLDVRYVDNVYGGEAVEAGGTIVGLHAGIDATMVTCDVWLRATERASVITGSADIILAATP
jgi:3-hydroxybutyryl-CoA dehydratase